MLAFAVKLILFYLTVVSSQTNEFSWVNPTDTFEFYYLESRFVKENNTVLLSSFNAYRSAVGFVDMNNGKQVTVEFIAANGVLSSLFPEWVQQKEDEAIVWENQYSITINQGPFDESWNSMYLLGGINGSTFLDYICWLPTYTQTPSLQYELFTIQSSPNAMASYLDSSSCSDFSWISFQVLYDLGADFFNDTTIPPTRDFIYLYSTEPQIVSYTGSEIAIQEFYNVFQWNPAMPNETFDQLISGTRATFNNTFFYYYYNQYFLFTLVPPYYAIDSVAVPLNNGIRSPQNVVFSCRTPPGPSPVPLHPRELSGGWIFVIIVLCGFTVYMAAGIAWKVKNGKRGAEAIPNIEFWTELPGLAKDGCKWVVSKLSGNRAREYETI